MSGVGSSSVPKGQVTGDNEPGIDTLIWVAGRLGVPKALTGRLPPPSWGAPVEHLDGTKWLRTEGRVHKTV